MDNGSATLLILLARAAYLQSLQDHAQQPTADDTAGRLPLGTPIGTLFDSGPIRNALQRNDINVLEDLLDKGDDFLRDCGITTKRIQAVDQVIYDAGYVRNRIIFADQLVIRHQLKRKLNSEFRCTASYLLKLISEGRSNLQREEIENALYALHTARLITTEEHVRLMRHRTYVRK